MKIRKITTYFLKLKRRGHCLSYQKTENEEIISDGYAMYILREDEMELNPNLFKESKVVKEIINKAITNPKKLTYENSRFWAIGLIDKYLTEDGKVVYINNEKLNFFDTDCELYFTGGSLSPVLVKEDGEVRGLILPIRSPE